MQENDRALFQSMNWATNWVGRALTECDRHLDNHLIGQTRKDRLLAAMKDAWECKKHFLNGIRFKHTKKMHPHTIADKFHIIRKHMMKAEQKKKDQERERRQLKKQHGQKIKKEKDMVNAQVKFLKLRIVEHKKHMKEARQGHKEMIQEIKNNFKRHFAQVKSSLDEVTWKLKQQQIKKRKLDEHSGIAVWSDVRTGRIHVQDGFNRRFSLSQWLYHSGKQSWDCSDSD
jgi:hypothetical protein